MGSIYKITCTVNDMSYIGFTRNDAEKTRIRAHLTGHGNQPLKDDVKEYGCEVFIFEILEDGIIPEFLPEREKYWIAKFDTFHNGYNLTSGGGSSFEVSEESRRKLSEIHKGKPLSAEHARKISEAKKGHTVSEETRRKLSKALKGKPVSPETLCKLRKIAEERKGIPRRSHSLETRRKMSESHKGTSNNWKGRKHTPESRRKMSKAKQGRKLSDETRRKMSEAHKGKNNAFYGKKHTPEARRRISEANRNRSRQGKSPSTNQD